MNKTWHLENRMPRNATLDERVNWHVAHAKACGCRPVPKTIAIEIERRKNSRSKKP